MFFVLVFFNVFAVREIVFVVLIMLLIKIYVLFFIWLMIFIIFVMFVFGWCLLMIVIGVFKNSVNLCVCVILLWLGEIIMMLLFWMLCLMK